MAQTQEKTQKHPSLTYPPEWVKIGGVDFAGRNVTSVYQSKDEYIIYDII